MRQRVIIRSHIVGGPKRVRVWSLYCPCCPIHKTARYAIESWELACYYAKLHILSEHPS